MLAGVVPCLGVRPPLPAALVHPATMFVDRHLFDAVVRQVQFRRGDAFGVGQLIPEQAQLVGNICGLGSARVAQVLCQSIPGSK